MDINWVTVYASSSDALSPEFYSLANNLARELAEAKINLVYGGSKVGIMGRVAQAMKEYGQKVIGVIPRRINEKVPPLPEIDQLIITETMYERKEEMARRGDAYICLPGGFGTLEEMLEIITQKQLHYHNKPIIICNFDGVFDKLFEQFQYLIDHNFAKEFTRELYYIAHSPDEIIDYLQNYHPLQLQDKWYDTVNGFKI